MTLPQRLRSRDPSAWTEFVRCYDGRIRRFVNRRIYGVRLDDVDDVVQDVFTGVWLSIDRYDERKSFATWVLTIAYRRTLDAINRSKGDRSVPAGDAIYECAQSGWSSVLDSVLHAESVSRVRQIVRDELSLHGVEQSALSEAIAGMPVREAAAMAGVSRQKMSDIKFHAMESVRRKVRKVLA
jgi:RNA polymerase sigma factor (sigma-70 family)